MAGRNQDEEKIISRYVYRGYASWVIWVQYINGRERTADRSWRSSGIRGWADPDRTDPDRKRVRLAGCEYRRLSEYICGRTRIQSDLCGRQLKSGQTDQGNV